MGNARPEKRYRFSIRKLNVGVVSVAISTFMFLGSTVALADNNTSESAVSDTQVADKKQNNDLTTESSSVTSQTSDVSRQKMTTTEVPKDPTTTTVATSDATQVATKVVGSADISSASSEDKVELPSSAQNVVTKEADQAVTSAGSKADSALAFLADAAKMPEVSQSTAERPTYKFLTGEMLKTMTPEEIAKLGPSDFGDFKMTDTLYNELSEEQVRALTFNKAYQDVSRQNSVDESPFRSAADPQSSQLEGYSTSTRSDMYKDGYTPYMDTTPGRETTAVIQVTGDEKVVPEVGRQYTIAASKNDIDQVGQVKRFYVTVTKNGGVIATKVVDTNDLTGGQRIDVDNFSFISVAMTGGSRPKLWLQKIVDSDKAQFIGIYGPSVFHYTAPSVTAKFALPYWDSQVTKYLEEGTDKKLHPDHVQYGWGGLTEYTTEPLKLKGYELANDPLNKDGIINDNQQIGNTTYRRSTISRGTLYEKYTYLDRKGTAKLEAYFTFAKAPGTFNLTIRTDKDRKGVNLPSAKEFFEHMDKYYIYKTIDTTEKEQENRTNEGRDGVVRFIQLRFAAPSPTKIAPTAEQWADAYREVILPPFKSTNSRYSKGRTMDVYNSVYRNDTVVYYYRPKSDKAEVVYRYVKNNGKFVRNLESSGEILGKFGESIKYSTAPTIKKYEDRGFELVRDGFGRGTKFDGEDGVQKFYVDMSLEKEYQFNKFEFTQQKKKPKDTGVHTRRVKRDTTDQPAPPEGLEYLEESNPVVTDPPKVLANHKYDVGTAYDASNYGPKYYVTEDGRRYLRVEPGEYSFGKVGPGGVLEIGAPVRGEIGVGPTRVMFVYNRLGSYLPYMTDTDKDLKAVPYDATPQDPSDSDPLPYVPNYTPKDLNGNPLKFVDPNNPKRGYIPPMIVDPKDVREDTLVPYDRDEGSVTVEFVDVTGTRLGEKKVVVDKVDTGTAYDTSMQAPKVLNEGNEKYLLVKAGTYPVGKVDDKGHLVSSDPVTGTVEVATKNVMYVYQKLGNYVPYVPTEPDKVLPKVPYDVTPEDPMNNQPLPYVPGYTPKNTDGTPLKPVDPKDLTKGYVPPKLIDPNDPSKDTLVPYEKDQKLDKVGSSTEQNRAQTGRVVATSQNTEPALKKPVATSNGAASQRSLPQTGDKKDSIFGKLGVLSMMFSLLGFFGNSRKNKKELK